MSDNSSNYNFIENESKDKYGVWVKIKDVDICIANFILRNPRRTYSDTEQIKKRSDYLFTVFTPFNDVCDISLPANMLNNLSNIVHSITFYAAIIKEQKIFKEYINQLIKSTVEIKKNIVLCNEYKGFLIDLFDVCNLDELDFNKGNDSILTKSDWKRKIIYDEKKKGHNSKYISDYNKIGLCVEIKGVKYIGIQWENFTRSNKLDKDRRLYYENSTNRNNICRGLLEANCLKTSMTKSRKSNLYKYTCNFGFYGSKSIYDKFYLLIWEQMKDIVYDEIEQRKINLNIPKEVNNDDVEVEGEQEEVNNDFIDNDDDNYDSWIEEIYEEYLQGERDKKDKYLGMDKEMYDMGIELCGSREKLWEVVKPKYLGYIIDEYEESKKKKYK